MGVHRKNCTEDFVLTQVMTRPPVFIYLAAFVGFVLAGLIYFFIIQHLFFWGGLPLAFGIMILIMMLLLKKLLKALKQRLDTDLIKQPSRTGYATYTIKSNLEL